MVEQCADYVTEREAAAIRGMVFGGWSVDHCNMTIRIIDQDGAVVLPADVVRRYNDDWRRSGLWSLPGARLDPSNDPSNNGA